MASGLQKWVCLILVAPQGKHWLPTDTNNAQAATTTTMLMAIAMVDASAVNGTVVVI